jgi:hypothetical protein
MVEIPKWKRFERLIHQLHEQWGVAGAQITLDDHIQGMDSRTLRQIDISIRAQVGPYRVLIVVECKDHATPLDVVDVGAFASLRDDVRANKGVIIATGGFTPAAVELARSRGIDTRTYLDTESEDWGTDVAVPMVLLLTTLRTFSFTFSNVRSNPFLPMAIPTNVPPQLIEVQTPEGQEIGPLILLLGQRWNHDETLHEPGEHKVTLTDHAVIHTGARVGHAHIEANLIVEKRVYTGPLGIHLVGFRDEQHGSIQTNRLRTDMIAAAEIARGLVPGWRELEEYRNYCITAKQEPGVVPLLIDGIPLEATLMLACTDALPETRDDLAEESPLQATPP